MRQLPEIPPNKIMAHDHRTYINEKKHMLLFSIKDKLRPLYPEDEFSFFFFFYFYFFSNKNPLHKSSA